MDTGTNSGEQPSEPIETLPQIRAITAIVEGAIDEFAGEKKTYEGLLTMCRHISHVFIQNAAYAQDYRLWVDVMNDVCSKRGIDFDAKETCDALVTLARTRALERQRTGDFAHLVSGADVIRARGLGIRLD
jgi:hypothetical protein